MVVGNVDVVPDIDELSFFHLFMNFFLLSFYYFSIFKTCRFFTSFHFFFRFCCCPFLSFTSIYHCCDNLINGTRNDRNAIFFFPMQRKWNSSVTFVY